MRLYAPTDSTKGSGDVRYFFFFEDKPSNRSTYTLPGTQAQGTQGRGRGLRGVQNYTSGSVTLPVKELVVGRKHLSFSVPIKLKPF